MAWRPANSLVKLRDQVNERWPNRSKASDGMIGDAAHAATVSDHNPNAAGVVCAFDITHDPVNGPDIDKLSDALAASRDPRIKYLIANRLIMVPADFGWKWVPYEGADPHTNHLHVSVYGSYDDTKPWDIGGEEMKPTKEEWQEIHQLAFQGDSASDETLNYLVGMPDLGAGLRWLHTGGTWQERTASIKTKDSQIADLASKVTTQATPAVTALKPGLYEVK